MIHQIITYFDICLENRMPSSDHLPVFLNACTLNKLLLDTQLIIVDLGRIDRYRKYHLPNALWLDYACLISGEKPATGLLPTNSALAKLIHSIGLKPDSIVVAYDDLGGGADRERTEFERKCTICSTSVVS